MQNTNTEKNKFFILWSFFLDNAFSPIINVSFCRVSCKSGV